MGVLAQMKLSRDFLNGRFLPENRYPTLAQRRDRHRRCDILRMTTNKCAKDGRIVARCYLKRAEAEASRLARTGFDRSIFIVAMILGAIVRAAAIYACHERIRVESFGSEGALFLYTVLHAEEC